MSFYKIAAISQRWQNNQGFINAMTVQLYHSDIEKMKAYVKTLTEQQRDHARNHLRTVIDLERQ